MVLIYFYMAPSKTSVPEMGPLTIDLLPVGLDVWPRDAGRSLLHQGNTRLRVPPLHREAESLPPGVVQAIFEVVRNHHVLLTYGHYESHTLVPSIIRGSQTITGVNSWFEG